MCKKDKVILEKKFKKFELNKKFLKKFKNYILKYKPNKSKVLFVNQPIYIYIYNRTKNQNNTMELKQFFKQTMYIYQDLYISNRTKSKRIQREGKKKGVKWERKKRESCTAAVPNCLLFIIVRQTV